MEIAVGQSFEIISVSPSGLFEFYDRIKAMKFLSRILAALAVAMIGTAVIAGIFWSYLKDNKIDFLKLQNQGIPNYQIGDNPVDKQTNKDDESNTSGENTSQEAPIKDIPEKKFPAESIILTPSDQDQIVANKEKADPAITLTRQGVIEETNRQRQINLGLGHTLSENALLDQAAQSKVEDMFAGQYFEHVSPLGDDASYFIGRTGYEYIAIGENLAMGNYGSDAALVQAWMDSPDHRENILKSGFDEIGVAVGYGNFNGRMVWLAVQEFGTPKSACPEVNQELSDLIDKQKEELDGYTKDQEKQSAVIDMKKDVAESLEEDLQNMSGSESSYSRIKTKQQELNDVIDQVNRLVNVYNESVRAARTLYEEYKDNVNNYNLQISNYNECLGSI